jgi:hypothetical protein
MGRNARLGIVAILLVMSFLLLPQVALPYDQLDWNNFTGIYPTPTPGPGDSYTFTLFPGAINDIAIPLDVVASGIIDAESLADYIEMQGGAPVGSVRQLLKWNPDFGGFVAWSHSFGFGDNFPVVLGDFIILALRDDAPSSVTLVGRTPFPGELEYDLVRRDPPTNCALNFLSLPLDQPQLHNADQLSDDIEGVVQALDWMASSQNLAAWSNRFNFGDNFPTIPGHPYIVCLEDSGSSHWP